MTRIAGWLVAAATALPCLLAPAAVANVESAGAAASHRYISVIAGNPHYLVYVPSTRSGSLGPFLHVMRKNGAASTLGRTAPHRGDSLDFSLVASSFTAAPGSTAGKTNPHVVFWWNLAKQTKGKIDLAVGDLWVGSAPGGFIYESVDVTHPGSSTYYRERVADRTSTRLTTPYPGRLAEVLPGPTGIVGEKTVGAGSARLSFLSYNGKHAVQLRSPSIPADDLEFPAMSSDYVTFVNGGDDGETHQGVLVPLDGSKSFVVGHTAYPLGLRVAYGLRHPSFQSVAGKVTTSRMKGEVVAAAFGTAIVTNHARTELESIAGASAKPKILLAKR
jgi:hypothetical protein